MRKVFCDTIHLLGYRSGGPFSLKAWAGPGQAGMPKGILSAARGRGAPVQSPHRTLTTPLSETLAKVGNVFTCFIKYVAGTFCEHKRTSLGGGLETCITHQWGPGQINTISGSLYPRLYSEGPKCCLKTLPTLTFFEDRGAGTLRGMAPRRVWSELSHLEDGRGLSIEVQDRLGMVPPALGGLELVADLDTDVGEAVLLTELQSHQGRQGWSWMWGRRWQGECF